MVILCMYSSYSNLPPTILTVDLGQLVVPHFSFSSCSGRELLWDKWHRLLLWARCGPENLTEMKSLESQEKMKKIVQRIKFFKKIVILSSKINTAMVYIGLHPSFAIPPSRSQPIGRIVCAP